MKKVILNDVALRESAQVAGGAMSPNDQDRYVKYLVNNGIDIIEIGYPGSSDEEPIRCKRLSRIVRGMKTKKKPLLSGLARAVESDILSVLEAGCDMVHIYIPVSDDLMLAQFNADKYGETVLGKQNWMIDEADAKIRYAKKIGFKHIQFSPEDSARAGRDFLCRIIEVAINAGATSINVPDTTGLCILSEYGNLIKHLFEKVPNIHKARISCHCHGDSDHSTANALQGIVSGVSEVQGTFYGLGERSGMTKFESVIMNVNTRRDIFDDVEIGFNSKMVVEIVNFVANSLGMPVPRHWVIAGSQNSLCSSGTHQSIEAKARAMGKVSPYYSWNPSLYGHDKVRTVLTNFSGRAGLTEKLTELGFVVNQDNLKAISKEVDRVSLSKKGDSLTDKEIAAIVGEIVKEIPNEMKLAGVTAIGGQGVIPTASVKIISQGVTVEKSGTGNGPISALFCAVVEAATEHYPILKTVKIELDDWHSISIGDSSRAMGDVYARIMVTSLDGKKVLFFVSRSAKDDTNHASARAFVNCLSWAIATINQKIQ